MWHFSMVHLVLKDVAMRYMSQRWYVPWFGEYNCVFLGNDMSVYIYIYMYMIVADNAF